MRNVRQPASGRQPSQSQRYDTVSKDVVQENPEDWLRFFSEVPDAEIIEVLNTEQPTVRLHRADCFIRVNVHGKEAIVHFEIQTHDSTQVPMPYRIAGYVGRGIETFQTDVYSHVVYLHPKAGHRDPGEYIQDSPGYQIRIQYKVIRLCEIEGQVVLNTKLKGLIPFAPLMKPPEGIEAKQWLRQCVQVADAVPMDEADKADYLAGLGILGGLIFDYQTIVDIISEETMHESSVIQHFTQQGARESTIEGILEALEIRFHASGVQTLKPTLEGIEELQRLKALRRKAMQVPSLDEFRRVLASNGS